MSSKPKARLKHGVPPKYHYEVTRKRCVFKLGQVPTVIDVLDSAAAPRPAKQDASGTLQLWGLACSINSKRLSDQQERIHTEAATLLVDNVDQDKWAAFCSKVSSIYSDCYDAWQGDKEGDDAPMLEMPHLLPDLLVCGELDELCGVCGGDDLFVASIIELYQTVVTDDDVGVIKQRREAIDKTIEMLDPERDVEIAAVCVNWDRAPTRLHGGYLRELLWMFDPVPDVVRDMIEVFEANQGKAEGCEPETT